MPCAPESGHVGGEVLASEKPGNDGRFERALKEHPAKGGMGTPNARQVFINLQFVF